MENELVRVGAGQEVIIMCGILEIVNDYEKEVLERNRIPNLIPLAVEFVDDTAECHYETTGYVSLEQYYQDRKMTLEEFKPLMRGIRDVLAQVEEYLLSCDGIALTPELIFIKPSDKRPAFCYQLGIRLSVEEEFHMLVDWLLRKIDYADKELVLAVYGIQSGALAAQSEWEDSFPDRLEEKPLQTRDGDGMKEEKAESNQAPQTKPLSVILTKIKKWFTLDS